MARLRKLCHPIPMRRIRKRFLVLTSKLRWDVGGKTREDASDQHQDEDIRTSPMDGNKLSSEQEDIDHGATLVSDLGMTTESNELIWSPKNTQSTRRSDGFEQLLFPHDDHNPFEAPNWSPFPRTRHSRSIDARIVEVDSTGSAESSSASSFKLPYKHSISIPTSPMYNDLCHRLEPVLNRCTLPNSVRLFLSLTYFLQMIKNFARSLSQLTCVLIHSVVAQTSVTSRCS